MTQACGADFHHVSGLHLGLSRYIQYRCVYRYIQVYMNAALRVTPHTLGSALCACVLFAYTPSMYENRYACIIDTHHVPVVARGRPSIEPTVRSDVYIYMYGCRYIQVNMNAYRYAYIIGTHHISVMARRWPFIEPTVRSDRRSHICKRWCHFNLADKGARLG